MADDTGGFARIDDTGGFTRAAPKVAAADTGGFTPAPAEKPSGMKLLTTPEGRSNLWSAIKQEPGRILSGMVETAKAPGQALASTPDKPVTTEEMIEPAANLGMMAGMKMGKGLKAPAGEPVGPTGTGGRLAPQAQQVTEAVKNAGSVIEKIASPETVDPMAKQAVAAIREAGGKAARDTAVTEQALEPAWKKVSTMPTQDRLNFIDYVEGRSSKYEGLEMKEPELKALADTLKGAFDQRMEKLEALPSMQKMTFIQDYYPHLWKDPAAAQKAMGGATKEGRSGFTKGRSVPTVADGLAAGLEPATTDPIAATLKYVANADRFIATNEVFDTAHDTGTVKYFKPGKAPEGWTEVKGRMGDKSTPAGPLVAYAPEGWARIYNNFVSRGIAEHGPEYQQAYDAVRHASNGVTAMELGLSGYHVLTMAQESMVNSVANAVGYARKGKPVDAVKSLGKAAVAPVGYAIKGKKLQDVYLGLSEGSKEMKQAVDLLTSAGGRAKGSRHAPDYDFSTSGSYITALKRGTLRLQLAADKATIGEQPVLGSVKVAAKHLGRIFDTVAGPVFQTYIPRIKNGAFYENMSAWLKEHPGAPREEQLNAARQVWDSIDNRFGELVQDNLFVSKLMKQVGMLSLRSWSWTVGGDVRELGGAMRDVARAPFKKATGTGPNEGKWTQKMDYAIALPVVYGTLSAIYQGLKTGQPPETMQDLLAPRTGGTDPATGQPERLVMPGYMKDVFGFAEHPVQEATGKIATAPKMAGQLATNQDWRGDPIFPPAGSENAPSWLKAFWDYASQNLGPISLRSAAKGSKTGSNLSMPEQVLGVRTAPRKLTDPEGYEQMMKSIGQRKWKDKERHDRTQQRLYE